MRKCSQGDRRILIVALRPALHRFFRGWTHIPAAVYFQRLSLPNKLFSIVRLLINDTNQLTPRPPVFGAFVRGRGGKALNSTFPSQKAYGNDSLFLLNF